LILVDRAEKERKRGQGKRGLEKGRRKRGEIYFEVNKSAPFFLLHADHIVPMKQITEMDGFNKLSFGNQLEVLNHKPNFSPLSETANTSRGAKTYEQWTRYKKGNVDVDPAFRRSMMERAAKLEVELQEKIYSLLP